MLRDGLAHGEATQPSLTRPHAAAREKLALVRTEATHVHHAPQFTRGDLFTAAHEGVVGGDTEIVRWAEESVEQRTDGEVFRKLAPMRRGKRIAFRGVDLAEPVRAIERRQTARAFGRACAGYGAAIASDVDRVDA